MSPSGLYPLTVNVQNDSVGLLRLGIFRVTVVLSMSMNVRDFDVITVAVP